MIHFAPLNTPLQRRLQTASVVVWLFMIPGCLVLFGCLCFFPVLWPCIAIYLVYIILDKTHELGGISHSRRFLRHNPMWKWYASFFPISVVKEENLDATKNYIFGYHPHGVIAVGAWTNFGTEATGISKVFPGLKFNLTTLPQNFRLPIYRDYMLQHGVISCSRESCQRVLSKGPGESIVIVVGGAEEALYAHPGKYDLVLKKRIGFLKLALQTGASLVPTVAFGENDIFNQTPNPVGSPLRKFQDNFHKFLGWTPPLISGRGIFQYDYGLLPHRKPITMVCGKPIHVEKVENPSEAQILEIQEKYLEELQNIFNNYKEKYASDRKSDLTLVQ